MSRDRRHVWLAAVHHAFAVVLVLALTIPAAALHRPEGRGSTASGATEMATHLDIAKSPSDRDATDNCHISGSCTILAIPQSDLAWVTFARDREIFGAEVIHWHGVALPPTARPPII